MTVDRHALQRVLDGRWAQVRNEIRAQMDELAFNPDPDLTTEEYRALTTENLKLLASTGRPRQGFDPAYGGGGDVGGVVTEITEANNDTVTGIVNITPPDLFMAGLVVPSVGVAGRTIGIQNSVINTATAPGTAPAFQVGLYLSADIDIQPGTDTLLATRAIATLGPSVTSTAPTPVALPPGAYRVVLRENQLKASGLAKLELTAQPLSVAASSALILAQ